MMQKLVYRTNLSHYFNFCISSNIQPTSENSVIWLKSIALNNGINSKIDYKYYVRFKKKIKKKLDNSDYKYFQFTLQFTNPN